MARLQVLGVRSVDATAPVLAVALEVDRAVTGLEEAFLDALGDGQSWSVTAQGSVVLIVAAAKEDVKQGLDTLLRQGFRVVEMQVVDRERAQRQLEEEAQALLAHFAE